MIKRGSNVLYPGLPIYDISIKANKDTGIHLLVAGISLPLDLEWDDGWYHIKDFTVDKPLRLNRCIYWPPSLSTDSTDGPLVYKYRQHATAEYTPLELIDDFKSFKIRYHDHLPSVIYNESS